MPVPLSVICSMRRPPSFTSTATDVAPASRLFSMSSFSADAGRWMTSPAAIRFTTASSSRRMGGGAGSGAGGAGAAAPGCAASIRCGRRRRRQSHTSVRLRQSGAGSGLSCYQALRQMLHIYV
jgi:hypothetical protein